jgi:hypothetical protein
MNTLTSKNPEQKIDATAALDHSLKRSIQLDSNANNARDAAVNANETTTDLKFCSVYGYRSKY